MLSIVIPAHNEESVIARGLRAIVTGAQPRELEVIVACNGCTDRTAELARGFGPTVRVIEIAQASKVAALNAADELATGFPRFYVDADVVLDLASIRAMAQVLERGDALLAAPALRMDLSQTTWPVRTFYRVWISMPHNRVMVGTGAYALSRAGRARFRVRPDVIADDGYVRFLYGPTERQVVEEAEVWVDPPRSLADLLRIKTRSRLGQFQLLRRFPTRSVSDANWANMLWWALRRPRLWSCLPVYLAVGVVVRLRAWCQLRAGGVAWARDESARQRVAERRQAVPEGGRP